MFPHKLDCGGVKAMKIRLTEEIWKEGKNNIENR